MYSFLIFEKPLYGDLLISIPPLYKNSGEVMVNSEGGRLWCMAVSSYHSTSSLGVGGNRFADNVSAVDDLWNDPLINDHILEN